MRMGRMVVLRKVRNPPEVLAVVLAMVEVVVVSTWAAGTLVGWKPLGMDRGMERGKIIVSPAWRR